MAARGPQTIPHWVRKPPPECRTLVFAAGAELAGDLPLALAAGKRWSLSFEGSHEPGALVRQWPHSDWCCGA